MGLILGRQAAPRRATRTPTGVAEGTLGTVSRTVPLVSAALVLVLGLAVHASSLPGADKLGDALYAALVVVGVWVLVPTAPLRVLAVAGLGWCWAVELLQLTPVPAAAAAAFPPARLVLGAGFDPLDLVAYAAGVGAAVLGVARSRGQ